jgi:hypothetical protein
MNEILQLSPLLVAVIIGGIVFVDGYRKWRAEKLRVVRPYLGEVIYGRAEQLPPQD